MGQSEPTCWYSFEWVDSGHWSQDRQGRQGGKWSAFNTVIAKVLPKTANTEHPPPTKYVWHPLTRKHVVLLAESADAYVCMIKGVLLSLSIWHCQAMLNMIQKIWESAFI